MELMTFITVLCLSFFALQTTCCTCLQIQLLQSSNEQEQAKGVRQLSPPPPTLPRKLRFTEEIAVKENGAESYSSSNTKQKEDVSGKARVHGSGSGGGTRQEWMESSEADRTEYFTMDYSNVRRRPPIHNKSLPVIP